MDYALKGRRNVQECEALEVMKLGSGEKIKTCDN